MTTILERLRRRRAALGMTQRDLAARMGVGQPYVCELEQRTELPRVATLTRWADALGFDLQLHLVDRGVS